MTYCPYCAAEEFAVVSYPDAKFSMCRECGVVFKALSHDGHTQLAASTYSVDSWGKDKKERVKAHGPGIRHMLQFAHSRQPFSTASSYLDIGAGVGVLEHVFFEMLGTKDVRITPLEPVPAIANFLQQEYSWLKVVNVDLEEFPKRSNETFDVVFCLGVDYLFRDLDAALGIISKVGRGRWIFSRAVFLDMASFFGGKKIESFRDLVLPNPLISTFMYADQYREMLARHFTVNAHSMFNVGYPHPGTVPTRFLIADCGPAPEGYPKPIRNPERAIKRLAELGVGVA